MTSIDLSSAEFRKYLEKIGPGLGRPGRPARCPVCDGQRVWYNGWRRVFCTVLADGVPYRFNDGLALQRAKCAACQESWTLQPAFLYACRSFAPDVVESVVLTYLRDPDASYEKTARAFGCSPRSLWRWVSWIAAVLRVSELLAEAEQPGQGEPRQPLPLEVPMKHEKAYSPERGRTLLTAFQGLVALAVWARARLFPSGDPSPLRRWLNRRFQLFRQLYPLVPKTSSPPLPVNDTGPPR